MSTRHRAQAGFCDLPVGLLDACELANCGCDLATYDSSSCKNWWRRRQSQDRYVRINPTQRPPQ